MIPKLLSDNPEFQAAFKDHENHKKWTTYQRRLLDLAKQAPFAGANEDFLTLMQSKVEEAESKIEMVDFLMRTLEEQKK